MSKEQVITLPTSLGNAEARKTARDVPWDICYPWGGDRFYGSEPEVRKRMQRAIDSYEKAEAAAEAALASCGVETKAEKALREDREKMEADAAAGVRRQVRIESIEGDERWWGEYVGGGVYKSLNAALSGAPLALPADYDMAPMREKLPDYPGPDQNGKSCRVCWGHLLKCKQTARGLQVEQIVGWEGERKST